MANIKEEILVIRVSTITRNGEEKPDLLNSEVADYRTQTDQLHQQTRHKPHRVQGLVAIVRRHRRNAYHTH